MQGRCSSAASARTRRRAKARLSMRLSIPETCTSSIPRQASASMAPMSKEHDNERVSNERRNTRAYADNYESLALMRDDDGLPRAPLPHRRRPGRVLLGRRPGFEIRPKRSLRDERDCDVESRSASGWARNLDRSAERLDAIFQPRQP